jgi:hypothetical protein
LRWSFGRNWQRNDHGAHRGRQIVGSGRISMVD